MEWEFEAEVWFWRGPAPHHFVTMPPEFGAELAEVAPSITYGWGMVPATVVMGSSRWTTALFPKDGSYVVPLRAEFRRREGVEVGDAVLIRLVVDA